PGEGGHLPARKVSKKVALARNAVPGIDLISPSNNHDIYSIEDLAQVIHELKTVNPRARVSVKVPVVPDIGVIAIGIAKAGADIVTLSGYDGGTGAARQQALRRAGLPVEIGVAQAHRALVAAGLRDVVEIWCDGGLKSALDVAKMLCVGGDRVDLGELVAPLEWTPPGRREVRVVAGVAVAEAEAESERVLRADDRFVATDASGELARLRIAGAAAMEIAETFREGSVAGNG